MKNYILIAPDGAEIIGTEETISAVAHIINPTPTEDGSFTFDHSGQTDYDDNGQETVRRLGECVYRDENGKLWLEREVRCVEEPTA